jgi:hypothetical protein
MRPLERLRSAIPEPPFEWALAAVALAWFVLIAVRTPVDVDEGYYGLAIELVAHGRVPYRDFFYPQGPLYPYLVAPFALVFGARFLVLRTLSALFATGAALLLIRLVYRETRSRLGTFVALAAFVSHELAWQWLTTIRPYGLAALCLLGALVLATPPERKPRPRELAIAGALAVIPALMRLPLAPTLGVVPLVVLLRDRGKGALVRGAIAFAVIGVGSSAGGVTLAAIATIVALVVCLWGADVRGVVTELAWYAGGAALVVVPVALVFAPWKDPALYNLVGFHTDSSEVVAWPQNQSYLWSVIGGGALVEHSAMGVQNALLLLAAIVALAFPRPEITLAGLVGSISLVVGASRHHPPVEHYITPVVPYLAVSAGLALGHVERALAAVERFSAPRPERLALFGFMGIFCLSGGLGIARRWGEARYPRGWVLGEYRPAVLDLKRDAVSRVIRESPGPMLATWPGTSLGNAKYVMSGYECHFGQLVASKKTPAERAQLHIAPRSDIRRQIDTRGPLVLVFDRESGIGAEREELEAAAKRARYRKRETVGDVSVYVRGD